MQLMTDRKIHPMGVKTLLASDVTAAVHGIDQAGAAQAGFTAQFSAKRFSDTPNIPVVTLAEHADSTVAELFAKVTGLVPSLGQVRRVARAADCAWSMKCPAKNRKQPSSRSPTRPQPWETFLRRTRRSPGSSERGTSSMRSLPDRDQMMTIR